MEFKIFFFIALYGCTSALAYNLTGACYLEDVSYWEHDALIELYNVHPSWFVPVGYLVEDCPCDGPAVHCYNGTVTRLDFLNPLTGSIPASIGNLTNLEILKFPRVPGSLFQAPIPNAITNLNMLHTFAMPYGLPLIPEIANLTNLQSLQLTSPNLPLPVNSIMEMDSVSKLILGGVTTLSPTINPEISYFPAVKLLEGSHLGGTLPSEIGLMQTLEEIAIKNTNMVGTIPNAIGDLGNLAVLILSRNQFSSWFPTNVYGHQVQTIDLSWNSFSGPIPTALAVPRYLDLSHNSFSGSIPKEFALNVLTDMELNFSYNSLSLPLPWTTDPIPELSVGYNSFPCNNLPFWCRRGASAETPANCELACKIPGWSTCETLQENLHAILE